MRDLDLILSYSTNLLTLHCVNSDGFGEDVCAFLRTSPTPGFLQNSFQDVFFILPFSLPEYALFTYARIFDVRKTQKPQSVLLISRSEDRQFVCFKRQTRALAFVCLYSLATGSEGVWCIECSWTGTKSKTWINTTLSKKLYATPLT